MAAPPHRLGDVSDPWAVIPNSQRVTDVIRLMREWDAKQGEIEAAVWSYSYASLPRTVIAEYFNHRAERCHWLGANQ